MRKQLARNNAALASVAPVVSHLLASSGNALVNDAILAQIRGMLLSLAEQILRFGEGHLVQGQANITPAKTGIVDRLAEELASEAGLLRHIHALAVEGSVTTALEKGENVDPIVSPLLQALIGSDKPKRAELAMQVLTAQSRFMQNHRRMGTSLAELPPHLLASALRRFEISDLDLAPATVAKIVKTAKAQYDEGEGRLHLLERLVNSMKKGAIAGLDMRHAGLALFTTALATRSGQSRDRTVLACHGEQTARLALSLRAAGVEADAIEGQVAIVNAGEFLPQDFSEISKSQAQSLLDADNGGVRM